MTPHRLRSVVRLTVRLTVRLSVALALSASVALGDDEARPASPSYTDADLARYAASRPPATPPAPDGAAPSQRGRRRSSSATGAEIADADREAAQRVSEERYWRREAERTRERVRRLEDQASALEAQLSERRRTSRSRRATSSANASQAALERRAGLARERAREAWDAFEDRARREGALPGWIR